MALQSKPRFIHPAALGQSSRPRDTPAPLASKLPATTAQGGNSMPPPGGKPVSRRLHRKQSAAYLGLSLSWLDKARLRGDGPVYLQIGGRIVYDTADLDDFLARCRRRSTSEYL